MALQRTGGSAAVRIGTRGSKLALAQAEQVRAGLLAAHEHLTADDIELIVIRTTGDRVTDRPLADIGGKGLFAKEVEEALLANDIDIAVHSMKDLETVLPDGVEVPCVLPRENPCDAFISPVAASIDGLPVGAVIGTSSQRRRAHIRYRRKDLEIVMFRGNIDTRLDKIDRGEVAATLLAMAGLNRLGLAGRATAILNPEYMLPAAGQGAVGIECRIADVRAHKLIRPLNHPVTQTCILCERSVLAALDGTCHTPIAAHARIEGGRLHLMARVLRPDGSEMHETQREGTLDEAEILGADAGKELRHRAGPDFFTEF
jgi:hydroxymethylbilane synthase